DEEDRWQSNIRPVGSKKKKLPSPKARTFYEGLCDLLARTGQRDLPFQGCPPAVKRAEWLATMIWKGSIDKALARNAQWAHLSKYQAELIDFGWIAVNGDFVWAIRPHTDA